MPELKCPKCGAEAFYNDEHPDGYYKANLHCSKCEWFEKPVVQRELTDEERNSLPF